MVCGAVFPEQSLQGNALVHTVASPRVSASPDGFSSSAAHSKAQGTVCALDTTAASEWGPVESFIYTSLGLVVCGLTHHDKEFSPYTPGLSGKAAAKLLERGGSHFPNTQARGDPHELLQWRQRRARTPASIPGGI